ncbi:MAG: hypothetical protein K6G83_12675 [Lachnospiraceae bacterium]|nr:hypothetical protein [Lachnospiraceae bacterium]
MEQKIFDCILSFIKKGALVSKGGEYLSPIYQMEHIRALLEDLHYMEDFMEDEDGNVVEVRFDRVSII